MKGFFRTTVSLSIATFLSRILGFIRDLLLARILGAGVIMSAWSYAWAAPNMFRKILGEGALGNVLVPILTETIEKQGIDAGRKKFSTVMLWLFFLLALITVLCSGGSLIISCFVESERWKLALITIPVIMPYCILICFIGIFSSFLNTLQVFVRPAFLNLLPNVFMIGVVYFYLPGLLETPEKALRTISIAMLISGVIELIVMFILLKIKGIMPKISKSILLNFSAVREIWIKVLPGLIGAGAIQIGAWINETLAMHISNNAKAAVYYSDRLVQLPIGLFGVAFGTVSLPMLSRYVSEGKMKSMLVSTFLSMRQMLFITIPITVMMVLFSKELLRMVFLGGKFGEADVLESNLAMSWYALGIPFYCLMKLSLNTFYCRKDMKTPAIVSICCIILNLVLGASLGFLTPLKQGGLSIASVITSTLNNIILIWILRKELGRMPLAGTVKFSLLILVLSGISGAAAYFAYQWIVSHPEWHFLPRGIIPFAGACCAFGVVFILLCLVFRVRELKALFRRFRRKMGK